MQNYYDSFSIGVDIETGGHVFQLHVTNSMPMHESGFITRTTSDWGNGGFILDLILVESSSYDY